MFWGTKNGVYQTCKLCELMTSFSRLDNTHLEVQTLRGLRLTRINLYALNQPSCFMKSNLLLFVKFFVIATFFNTFEIIKVFSYLLCFIIKHVGLYNIGLFL